MAEKSQQNRERRILQFDAIAKLGTVLCPAGSACLSSRTFVHCAATAKRIVVPFHRLLASLVIIVAPRRWVQNGQNNSGVPRFASERTLRKIQALLLPIELHLQDSKTVFFFSKKKLPVLRCWSVAQSSGCWTWRSAGRRLESRPPRVVEVSSATLGKLFTHLCLSRQAVLPVAANWRLCSAAGEVITCLGGN